MTRNRFAAVLLAFTFAATTAALAGCNDGPDTRNDYERDRDDFMRDEQYP